jgi:soluble lytic murein transglycosylase-like protein
VIIRESKGDPNEVGEKGERGLMQILKTTWYEQTKRMFGKPLPFNRAFEPTLNKKVGTGYLEWIRKTLARSDWMGCEPSDAHILAAYNGGIGKLRKNKYIVGRMPKSTRSYVKFVLKLKRSKAKPKHHKKRK